MRTVERPRRRVHLVWWLGVLALGLSVVFVIRAIDPAALRTTWRAGVDQPPILAGILVAYAGAFVLRALIWTRVLPGLGFGHALAALHLALGGNHVLPLRLGEALRVTSVVRRTGVGFGPATASTVLLRGADILAVTGLAALLGPRVVGDLMGAWGWLLFLPAAGLWFGGLWWLRRLDGTKSVGMGRSLGLVAFGATVAWVLEATVIWQTARWAGLSIGFADAVLVTAVTIVAQSVAVTPAGIGTYEAAASAAFVALGADPGAALAAAIAAHALKTAYALVTGAVSLFVPAPGALGRLRLPPTPPPGSPPTRGQDARRAREPVPVERPVVLFMPAHNEAASVASVVRRAPAAVGGHPIVRVVVDDGSRDGTAALAGAAGAEVVSYATHRGLGHA
ncbi:MAG: lysylphosphatidylglycerol synthase domain-containing protein, partial [Actinomycetota bacterium]